MNANFVELWHGEMLSENEKDRDYLSLLSEEEKKRSAKFVRQDLQKKYVKTRGVLRTILASHLNNDPQKIIIKTTEHGKPFVSDKDVYFNLSHTGNKFVIAVSNCSHVGVDIEQYKHRNSLSALVEKCFSETEANYWNALPANQQTEIFFRFWVRKEAFVKAVGRGIGLGLNQCSINPQSQNCFISIPDQYGLISDWKIVDIELDNFDVCAIVTRNIQYKFSQSRWD